MNTLIQYNNVVLGAAIQVSTSDLSPGETHGGVVMSMRAIAASMIVGTSALAVTGVQPVLLGALTEAHRLTATQLGHIATLEMLLRAFASAVAVPYLQRGSMPIKAFALSALLVCVDLAVYVDHSVTLLFVLRGAAGIIEGFLMGVVIITTISSRHPDRLNGIFWGVAAIPISIAAYVMSVWILPHFGADGGFALLAGFALVSAIAAGFLVDQAPRSDHKTRVNPHWRAPTYLAFTAILLQFAASGGAWGYLQLLADQHRFPAGIGATAVSVGLVAQVIGALLASLVSSRIPCRAFLILQCAVGALLLIELARSGAPGMYVGLSTAWSSLLLAQIPFQVLIQIAHDETRRAALYSSAVGLFGLSLGPWIGSLGVNQSNVAGAFDISAALMVAAGCCYVAVGLTKTMTAKAFLSSG